MVIGIDVGSVALGPGNREQGMSYSSPAGVERRRW